MDSNLKHCGHSKTKAFDQRLKIDTKFSTSFQDDSLDKVMVIGKKFPLNKSKTLNSSYHLHECHSDTSLNPLRDSTQHKDSFPSEGLHTGLSEHPSASSISFASAISDFSPSEIIQKKLHEMECELSEKDATISFLKQQLSGSESKKNKYVSTAIETDLEVGVQDYYQAKLNEFNYKINKREKTISELSKELEEAMKTKGKQIEENRNLIHEVNLLNRQLHSMYELVESKHWHTGIDPKEFAKYKSKAADLEDSLSKKDKITTELQDQLMKTETNLEAKDRLLEETRKTFLDYKNSSSMELASLSNKISSLENDAALQEKAYSNKLLEAQKNMDDEIVSVTKKLEIQYQEDVKAAVERCRMSFKKLAEMPKTRIENILKLCETGKLDIMMLQKDWEDQKKFLEKRVVSLEEEKNREMDCLVEGYESKISSLRLQIESLNEQLQERKETLATFENELKLHRDNKAKQDGKSATRDFNELKQLHAAEISSQQEQHKLEMDLLQDKVKKLSEEILSHANNEKIHLQEIENAKLMASTFREKYERLLTELEEKIKSKEESDHLAVVNELDLEDSIIQLRGLILSLKKAEELHEGKIKYMKQLDKDEILMHQKEMNLFKAKLEQVDRFQTRLRELDADIQELIKTAEMKYMSTVQSLTYSHYSEVRLKELEMDSMEHRNASKMRELEKKVKDLEESNKALENEIKTNNLNYEKEIRSLKSSAEELTVELLRNEGMLTVKAEIEDTLTKRVEQLESLLSIKNENSKMEMENVLSKCIATEALLSAKEEIVTECESRLRDSEKILLKTEVQAGFIEEKCMKMKESFQRVENMTQIIVDMNDCDSYFQLKSKIDQLSIEFAEVCTAISDLEAGNDSLSKQNALLTKERKELTKSFKKVELERDQILENYRMIEDEMNKVMERSRNFENELNKMTSENSLIVEKCNEIIRKNSLRVANVSPGNLLEKLESIGVELNKTLSKVENKIEVPKSGSCEVLKMLVNSEEEKQEILERERQLKEENQEILDKSNILRENMKLLSKKVDGLLLELSANKEGNKYFRVLYCEPKNLNRDESDLTLACEAAGKCPMANEKEVEEDNAFCEEMVLKLENIEKRMSEVMDERNNLIVNVESLEEERYKLKVELEELRDEHEVILNNLKTETHSEPASTALMKELTSKEFKINEMRQEMTKMSESMKILNRELDVIKVDNENLISESHNHLINNQCLKDELEEAWSQRYEIEDQLTKLRTENVVLNLHRNQLEQTNRRISNLISEGTPCVVSWMKIHETVENIVDVVQTLKTSFSAVDPVASDFLKTDGSKTIVDFIPESLHLEVQNKTKLCQELVSQKLMLEKELQTLELLVKQNEGPDHCECSTQQNLMLDKTDFEYCSPVQCFNNQNIVLTDDEIEILSCEEESYLMTLHKLKKHFENQMHLQEANLTEALVSEIKGIKREMLQPPDDEAAPLKEYSCENREIERLKERHKEEIKEINREHEAELEKLRDILKEMGETGNNSLLIHEIESKHSRQMEELRRYFEKKCEELEKNFSEEVFSQQSRKMSNSSDTTIGESLEEPSNADRVPDTDFGEKDVIIQKYRSVLDEEENDEKRKERFLKYLTEIVNAHAEEVTGIKNKHHKEMANLQKRHAAELAQLNDELSRVKSCAESEKELIVKNYENRMKEIVTEERKAIAAQLEREFENKVKVEIKKFSDLLQAESKAHEKETVNLEESCVEKLSEYETESALRKIETEKEFERKLSKSEKKFKKELEEEKVKIAQHYKELNEAALKKFNEEQEHLIKSHSEIMHSLIQDHEAKITQLKKAHEQDLEKFHCDKEVKLAIEFRNKEKKFEHELSSMKSTYEGELYELKKCCQDILNEQVNLAKADAFNNLQKQIQNYLDGEDKENLTSKEVVELGEKFAGKYRREIEELKQKHYGEVTRIRSEYEEKIKRRYSTGSLPKKPVEKMEMKTDDDKVQILRERDALQEMVSSLRHVLSELIRYVGSCEDELNNTIIGEFSKNEETLYKSFVTDSGDLNETNCSILSKKVHFAPDLSNIISEINDSPSFNTSLQVRAELDRCLKQLKSDASHLLALSNPSKRQDENLYDLLLKFDEEKNQVAEKVTTVEEMQKNLKMELNKTRWKLAELERTREVVSEGYGEEVVNAKIHENMNQLKEKAKELMGQHCSQPSDILNVLEEICKEGDRLQEEARQEKNDLQQQEDFTPSGTVKVQVSAADKQLRSIRKFLEEQAAEREMERDDFINEIKRLKDALRMGEKDKSLQDRMNKEVDALENQLRDASGRLAEVEKSKTDVENQLKEAVDKIWTLRDIIRELEAQVATVSERESSLKCKIEELETDYDKQEKMNRNLVTELNILRTHAQTEYMEQIKKLEEEWSVLRRATDRLNSDAISQMRMNLREIELSLTKKTKDLEQLHMSSTNVSCSSPSEDISICERLDATRCTTPDEMDNVDEIQKWILPLEEIDRINEKLIRHTRAEEVAIKTVRDLEMQLKSNRKVLEENQIERDVLLERADKYLQENSRLKVRLDEQRCNAGIIQRQLSADLEAQIKRLEFDIEKLNDLCVQKDKQIRDMNVILEQTTKSLKIREAEVLNKSNEENELIANLKTELQNAIDEKKKLEETVDKMKETLHDTVTVPLLIDSMIEEKNAEIDRLEKEVSKLKKDRAVSTLVRAQSSVDSDNSSRSTKKVKFSEPDSFVQFVSPISAGEPSVLRCASDSYADLKISSHKLNKQIQWVATPESLSSIGPLQLSPRGLDSQLQWSNNNIYVSSPKRPERSALNEDVELLRQKLNKKEEEIKKYDSQLTEQTNMDVEIDEIRVQLKSTANAVEEDKSFYKKEFEKMLENESKVLIEIDLKKREISEHLLEIDTLKRKLAEANLWLETSKSEYQKLENDSSNKDEEIRKLNSNAESLLMTIETLKSNHLEEVEELQSKLSFEHDRVESVLSELKVLEVKKVEIEEEFLSLKEDYAEKLNLEQNMVSNLKAELSECHQRNMEINENYKKLEKQMGDTLKEANSLSKELTEELNTMKNENNKLKSDYLTLKKEWDDCIAQMSSMPSKNDVDVQVVIECRDEVCETNNHSEPALEPLRKSEMNEELSQFQANIDKLKSELGAWEQRMDERELHRDEILSYIALVRTLILCIIENLDDHFYELQTYRMKIMECSVDDLTNRVQKELLLSAKLDSKLLSNFQAETLTTDVKSLTNSTEDQSTIIENGGGDNNLSIAKKKQNLVNLTVKLYELETNLQEMEQRNKEFESQIASIKSGKEEERKRAEGLQMVVRFLEDCLSKEKIKLAEEKARCDEDAKIMEVLRVNFEISMEKIDELDRALTAERQLRMTLEKQIKLLQNPVNSDAVTASGLKCQLEIERQKCFSLELNIEKEKKKCQELKLQLEQVKLEQMAEKDVQRLMNKDLALFQEQKDHLESQLTFARELLQSRQEEIASLKRKMNLQEIDIKALTISTESQQEKEAEISMMAEKIANLEKEVGYYREQMQTLNEKSESISAPLLMKMKILNNCVQQHVQESNEMGEALLHLTQETEQMRSLIKKIEETSEQSGAALSNSSDETLLADGDTDRKSWMDEKENLLSELEKAKCDYEILKRNSMEVFKSNDLLKLEVKKLNRDLASLREELEAANLNEVGIPEERVLHLFGKYMRTESFRKALAFQKLYLTRVLKGYESEDEEALVKLLRSGSSSRRREAKRKLTARSKRKSFKMVGLVIIAIKRMQFMVARWRLVRLTGFSALMGHLDASSANKENEYRRHSSTADIHTNPIDPLRYQTQYIRQQQQRSQVQTNVLRTPASRDPDSRVRSVLDVRKISDNIEKFNCLHKNLGLPSRPP